jgi:hypothetical protein
VFYFDEDITKIEENEENLRDENYCFKDRLRKKNHLCLKVLEITNNNRKDKSKLMKFYQIIKEKHLGAGGNKGK